MFTVKVRFRPEYRTSAAPRVEVEYGGEVQTMILPVQEDGEVALCTIDQEDTLVFEGTSPKAQAGPPSRAARKLSKRQERKIAEDLGGRVQPASGARPGAKGDVRVLGRYRVEAKSTKARSYRLGLDDLNKISGECTVGEKPAFVVSFLTKDGRVDSEYALVPYRHFLELTREPPGDDRRPAERRPGRGR